MARTALRILLGFLSTAVFLAAFILVGDVLLAAIAATAVVVVQFVFGRTTSAKPSVAIWASLAIVLTLTGVSLMGDDANASLMSRTDITGFGVQLRLQARDQVHGLPVPFLSTPKTIAPAPGPV